MASAMPDSKRRPYKDLSLTQLRSFCAVCERKGYAAAARALLLTSPAVWEQVHGLERYLGVRLLERYGAGVRPTARGEWHLGRVLRVRAGLDGTGKELQQDAGGGPKRLTLGTN